MASFSMRYCTSNAFSILRPPRLVSTAKCTSVRSFGTHTFGFSCPNPSQLLKISASSSSSSSFPEPVPDSNPNSPEEPESRSFWKEWQTKTADMRSKIAKLGLAAVLAYGLFDGVTYTTFFILAFLGYEKSTGKNPAANIQALLGIVILMWTGNNVTRPFRVAGAAALAPIIDKGLKKLQQALNLPSQIYAFMLVVVTFASICLSIVGLLILSRWGK